MEHLAKYSFAARIKELTKSETNAMTNRPKKVELHPRGMQTIRECIEDRILSERRRIKANNEDRKFNQVELAEAAGVSIDTLKRFCRGIGIRYSNATLITNYLGLNLDALIESPAQQHPSNFYVERFSLEDKVSRDDLLSKKIIRIKAPRKMGKTSLAIELLSHLKEYETVYLSFCDVNPDVFTDLERFLKWFCIQVADSLMSNYSLENPDDDIMTIVNRLEEKWSNVLDQKGNCTKYFEDHLLATTEKPIILVLDDVDLVFDQPSVRDDFCQMLRSWYNRAMTGIGRGWTKMNLIVIHSTDIYGELDINSSPLKNVGEVFQPKGFNSEQVKEMVQKYQLGYQSDEIERLRSFMDGNPYLIRKALNYLLTNRDVTLEHYLQNIATTPMGPYHNYLIDLWSRLSGNPTLITIFQEILNSTTGIQVNQDTMFQLDRMGLIQLEEHSKLSVVSCKLYREYFLDRLRTQNN
jgi:transcriptional regulator with XRE-family HTH domain